MFQIDKTIISEAIIQEDFVCNLSACKGGCCVGGDAGAPLEKEEIRILEELYPLVKPYMEKRGIEEVEKQGVWVTAEDGDLETPLVDNGACAYVTYEEGKAICAIEKAYNDGVVDWKKPISCHLYPVRVNQYSEFSAVNYHQWDICDDACVLGRELQVPIYKFVKEALIRKFGEEWYQKLEQVARECHSK